MEFVIDEFQDWISKQRCEICTEPPPSYAVPMVVNEDQTYHIDGNVISGCGPCRERIEALSPSERRSMRAMAWRTKEKYLGIYVHPCEFKNKPRKSRQACA